MYTTEAHVSTIQDDDDSYVKNGNQHCAPKDLGSARQVGKAHVLALALRVLILYRQNDRPGENSGGSSGLGSPVNNPKGGISFLQRESTPDVSDFDALVTVWFS